MTALVHSVLVVTSSALSSIAAMSSLRPRVSKRRGKRWRDAQPDALATASNSCRGFRTRAWTSFSPTRPTTPHQGSPSGTRFRNFFDDALSPEDYRQLVRTTAQELFRVLKMDPRCYVFMGWKLGVWLDELSAPASASKNVIVWDKVVHGMNYQKLRLHTSS